MTNGKENRQSFRISESALLQYETISEADFKKGLESWNIRVGTNSCIRPRVLDLDSRLEEVMYRVKNDAPPTYDAIELLSQKIDIVLELLPEFSQSKQALGNQPAQICELSAEGIAFGCDELLHPQTKLLLRFLLVSDSRFWLSPPCCSMKRLARPILKKDSKVGTYCSKADSRRRENMQDA